MISNINMPSSALRDIVSTTTALCFCVFILFVPCNNKLTISAVSIIYFLLDMYFQKMSMIFMIHHILSICGFVWLIFAKQPYDVYLFIDCLKALELSNLTLYLNCLLIYSNLKDWNSPSYKWFFMVHVVNYIFWRVIYFGIKIYNNTNVLNNNPPLKISAIIFLGGLYWSILLIIKFKRKCIN